MRKYFKNVAVSITILISSTAFTQAQQYYVSASPFGSPDNKTYALHIDSCGKITDSTNLPIYTCHSPGHINDIAVDKDSTIWYVIDTVINKTSYSALAKRKLSDSNCQLVVQFPHSSINSLVADTVGNIYATGGYGGAWLYKYDGTNLSIIDSLPKNMAPAGDLFFYDNRLFITCNSTNLDTGYIAEYNLNYPGHGCYYMSLDSMRPYGAFTVYNEGTSDRVFILTVHPPNYDKTSLVEIDIPNKKILNTLCTYSFVGRGGASRYPAVWASSNCPPPSGINDHVPNSNDITVLQPVRDRILLKTEIKRAEINSISLYSLSGQRLKSYTQNDFPDKLEASNIPGGLYLLQVKTINGNIWNKKVLKVE